MSRKYISQGVIVALLLASAMPGLTLAQSGVQNSGQSQAAPGQNAPARPDLNLSDDQKAQMKKIHEDAKSQIAAVNSDSSLSTDQKQAKIQQIHRDAHKQVEAILTPEQRKTMKEWRHEHRGEQQTPPSN
jgi:Spy/CpxP family protein refolding chaperone